jgi:integrase
MIRKTVTAKSRAEVTRKLAQLRREVDAGKVVVSEVLGHSSIRMTADVYGHILDPDRQQAASAMSEVLWGDTLA